MVYRFVIVKSVVLYRGKGVRFQQLVGSTITVVPSLMGTQVGSDELVFALVELVRRETCDVVVRVKSASSRTRHRGCGWRNARWRSLLVKW